MMIGEEPYAAFLLARCLLSSKCLVEESDLTPTQQNLQAQQMMDMNQLFGREVFPPSMIIPKLNITGKGEIIPFLQQQEQQCRSASEEARISQHTVEEMKSRN